MDVRTLFPSLAVALAVGWLGRPSMAAAQVQQPPPVIERIEPTLGPPGTTVQMIGRFFRPEQTVRLGDTPVEVLSRMPNRWTFRVPPAARGARIVIELPGTATVIGPEFRVLAAAPPPVIADVQPRTAAPGAEVRILGENFSPRITENVVTLGNLPVVVRHATPTELVVIVPQGAQTGRFVVRVTGSGEATAGVDLAIGAGVQITGFQPTIAPPGARVHIEGAGFVPRARDVRVFLGNTPLRVVVATATGIVAELPADAATGTLMVEVRGVGRAYASQPLTVQPVPSIASFEPPAGPPGTQVRIRGANFGSDVRLVQVQFGGVDGIVRGLAEGELVAEVPAGAQSGPITVSVHTIGPVASRQSFQVLVPPQVADFQPRSGGIGTEVVITGTGFSPVAHMNRVLLSHVVCPILRASATELRVRIPEAASGPLVVEVEHGGRTQTTQPFVVTTPPFVARLEPERGTVGTVLTIHGTGFGTNPALVEAAIGERRMEIRSVTPERIEAVVPAGATTGRVRVTVRLQGSSMSQREFVVLGDFAVSAIEPPSAYPGQSIALRGVGFAPQGFEVRFTGARDPVPYTFYSSSEIRVVVPESAQSGPLTVRSPDGREATQNFTLAPTPEGVGVTVLEPACLRPGCRVVVRGYGFQHAPGRTVVTVGTTRVRVRRVSPYQLEFELPRSVGTMTVRVEVPGRGTAESPAITVAP